MQQLEAKYEEEKRRGLAQLESVRKRATEKEAAVQAAATKQAEVLTGQVQELQQKLRQRLQEVDSITKNAKQSQQVTRAVT